MNRLLESNGYSNELICDIIDAVIPLVPDDLPATVNDWVERSQYFGWAFSRAVDRWWTWSEGTIPYTKKQATEIAQGYANDEGCDYVVSLIEHNYPPTFSPIDSWALVGQFDESGPDLADDGLIADWDYFLIDPPGHDAYKDLQDRLDSVWQAWIKKHKASVNFSCLHGEEIVIKPEEKITNGNVIRRKG